MPTMEHNMWFVLYLNEETQKPRGIGLFPSHAKAVAWANAQPWPDYERTYIVELVGPEAEPWRDNT